MILEVVLCAQKHEYEMYLQSKNFGKQPSLFVRATLRFWPQESKVWRQLENYVAVPVQVVLSEYARPNKIRAVLPFNLNRCESLVDLHHNSGSTLSHGIISFCYIHFWCTTLLLFLWGWVKQMLIPQWNTSPLLKLEWDIFQSARSETALHTIAVPEMAYQESRLPRGG